MANGQDAERFWGKVDIRGTDECWDWQAGKFNNGYGKFKYGGNNELAHRVAWALANGEIPDGLIVRHKCDRKLCCNPAHLELGTQADNMHDMMERGRGRAPRGEDHGQSKLTEDDVREIREMAAVGEIQRVIAERFDISETHVSNIVAGKRWAWLEEATDGS